MENVIVEKLEIAVEKTQKQLEREANRNAKLLAMQTEKEAKHRARIEKKLAKEQTKEAEKIAKEAAKQPIRNDIRRPKPNCACGKVWSIADTISTNLQRAVSISELLEVTQKADLNPSNVRAEYVRWKKFHGIKS